MNIIAEAQQGDREAWEKLYRLVSPKLIVFIRSKGVIESFENEEDLVSETWFVIAQKIHEFTGEDEHAFTGWAFTIAHNHLLNSNHKALRRKTEATDSFTFVDRAQWDQDWLQAEELLRLVPEKDRELLVLIDLLDFTSREAGKILGIKPATVRVQRARALKALRKIISTR